MEAWTHIWLTVVNGFPFFIAHFFVTLLMFALSLLIYVLITPMQELRLIREGNIAASLSFSGASIGLAIPLSVCLSSSFNIPDIVVWGSLALLIQLLCFRFADFILTGLPRRIQEGEVSAAIVLFTLKISVSLFNAAAIA
tara:strand:- start:139 stop:558 length:420 start_codon:yes stop_codon:yes gene_type:complete